MGDVRDRETRTKGGLAEIGVSSGRLVPAERARGRMRRKKSPKEAEEQVPQKLPLPPRALLDEGVYPEVEAKPKFNFVLLSFIAAVLLPFFAASIYLFAIASDQYTAEMRFAVRDTNGAPEIVSTGTDGTSSSGGGGPGGSGASGTASVLATTTLTGQNAEIVTSFIQSRGAIDEVARLLNVRAIFQRPEADIWARLPDGSSPEDLLKYWNKKVDVNVDNTTGIVDVEVTAFRREDALALAQAILKACDDLVKAMSLKIRTDILNQAESEVRKSEGDTRNAMKELTEFRNNNELIDPVKATDSTSALLLQLMSSKIQTEAQLFVADRTGPNAPGLKAVRAQLASIDNHIDDLKQQLAGQKQTSKNMAATLAKFEELDLNRLFAEKMLGYARTGLEQARIAAMQQMIYIAVFVPPALPEDYSYPLRATDAALVGIAFLMFWGTITTLTASVLDHRT